MNIKTARIIKIIKDDVWVEIENHIIKTNLLGIFRNKNIKPICGDIVKINTEDKVPMIIEILDRKNMMIRPKVANVDIVVIVQSTIQPDFNTILLDKMITFYRMVGCNVIVALTKTDVSYPEKIRKYVEDYKFMNHKIYDVNNENDFINMMTSFKKQVVCFVGNSGVGKSTLINKINPNLNIKTQEISKALNRGKHTTTNTTIIKEDGFYVVDTPGYSSITLECSKDTFAHKFFDLSNIDHYCKFNDCLHVNAKDCVILELLENKKIFEWRYNNYIQILDSLEKRYDK
ncbi:MAG: ribosome small subunit-dependent GTPase A [Mycoplasma sp.]